MLFLEMEKMRVGGGETFLHKALLSLGRAPFRGVLLLEVFLLILGQVNQASAENSHSHHGQQQEDAGVRAHLPAQLPEGPRQRWLQAVGVAAGPLGRSVLRLRYLRR